MKSDNKTWYVERVRELLRSELADEDLDLLSSDLEEQLSDMNPSDVENRLGSPEDFVDTYRASAGIETQAETSRPRSAVVIERWLDERKISALGRVWYRYQHAWWLVRGWVMLMAFALVSTGPPSFRPFPIPNIDAFPTTSFMVLVASTAASILLSRSTRWLPGRIVNILVSAFAAYVAFVAAVNT
jgi:hypothetical protein